MKKFLVWLMTLLMVVTFSLSFLHDDKKASSHQPEQPQVTSYNRLNDGPWPPPDDGG